MSTPYGKDYVPDPRFGVQAPIPQAPAPVERDRSAQPVWNPTDVPDTAPRWQNPPPVLQRQDLLPSYGGYAPPARTGMPTWAKVLIGVGGGVVGVVILLIIAAVAIPVFLTAREGASSTEAASAPPALALPDAVAGMPRLNTPEAQAMVDTITDTYPAEFPGTGAIYGSVEEPLAVIIISFPSEATESNQADFREAAAQDPETGLTIELIQSETGMDDAWFGCAQTFVNHFCMSTQPNGAILVVTPQTGVEAEELSRAAHAATVG